MLKIVDEIIEGDSFDIFQNKDSLKSFYCTWDPEIKKWRAPYGLKLVALETFIMKFNEQQKEHAKLTWQRAMENLNLKFVKKDTPDYVLVKAKFRELIKNV